MTLPEFQYSHQNAAHLEAPCHRILEQQEHDDLMDADAHDLRRAIRDGWISNWGVWDGR